MATKWHTPIVFHAGRTLAWIDSGKRENGLQVFILAEPGKKDKVLSFPMKGKAKGCVQVLDRPSV
jgi:hypothetical protein